MRRRAVGPWCGRAVELAARVLPPGQRQRYARELVAELHGMTRGQQRRHALGVLTHAWALRTALVTTNQEEGATTTTTRRPLRCRIGLHDWDERENPETKERYEVCLRCDAYRDRPQAAPGTSGGGIFSGISN